MNVNIKIAGTVLMASIFYRQHNTIM